MNQIKGSRFRVVLNRGSAELSRSVSSVNLVFGLIPEHQHPSTGISIQKVLKDSWIRKGIEKTSGTRSLTLESTVSDLSKCTLIQQRVSFLEPLSLFLLIATKVKIKKKKIIRILRLILIVLFSKDKCVEF